LKSTSKLPGPSRGWSGFAALLILVGCSNAASQQALAFASGSAQTRVKAIQAEAKRIDSAMQTPSKAGLRKLTRELPHWEFTGALEASQPVFVSARFSEGQAIREESYYLIRGNAALVKVETWWDVEDPRRAPEPRTIHEYYIDHGQTIWQITRIASSPARTLANDTIHPASALLARSRTIQQIIFHTGAADTDAVRTLDEFPEAGTPHRP